VLPPQPRMEMQIHFYVRFLTPNVRRTYVRVRKCYHVQVMLALGPEPQKSIIRLLEYYNLKKNLATLFAHAKHFLSQKPFRIIYCAFTMTSRSPIIAVRSNFLLFIRILFRCLEKSQDELLIEQAKLVVFNCRMTEQPDQLRQSIQRELRDLVGMSTWHQAERLTIFYLRKQQDAKSFNKDTISQPGLSIPGWGNSHTMMDAKIFAFEPNPIVYASNVISL
jgi:hypothetical protein